MTSPELPVGHSNEQQQTLESSVRNAMEQSSDIISSPLPDEERANLLREKLAPEGPYRPGFDKRNASATMAHEILKNGAALCQDAGQVQAMMKLYSNRTMHELASLEENRLTSSSQGLQPSDSYTSYESVAKTVGQLVDTVAPLGEGARVTMGMEIGRQFRAPLEPSTPGTPRAPWQAMLIAEHVAKMRKEFRPQTKRATKAEQEGRTTEQQRARWETLHSIIYESPLRPIGRQTEDGKRVHTPQQAYKLLSNLVVNARNPDDSKGEVVRRHLEDTIKAYGNNFFEHMKVSYADAVGKMTHNSLTWTHNLSGLNGNVRTTIGMVLSKLHDAQEKEKAGLLARGRSIIAAGEAIRTMFNAQLVSKELPPFPEDSLEAADGAGRLTHDWLGQSIGIDPETNPETQRAIHENAQIVELIGGDVLEGTYVTTPLPQMTVERARLSATTLIVQDRFQEFGQLVRRAAGHGPNDRMIASTPFELITLSQDRALSPTQRALVMDQLNHLSPGEAQQLSEIHKAAVEVELGRAKVSDIASPAHASAVQAIAVAIHNNPPSMRLNLKQADQRVLLVAGSLRTSPYEPQLDPSSPSDLLKAQAMVVKGITDGITPGERQELGLDHNGDFYAAVATSRQELEEIQTQEADQEATQLRVNLAVFAADTARLEAEAARERQHAQLSPEQVLIQDDQARTYGFGR